METKPGYQTTEFWVTILTALAGLINWTGIWDFMSNYHSGVIAAVVAAAYTVSRGIAKQGVAYTPPPNR